MLARNSTSLERDCSESFGAKPSNTPSWVSSVSRELRSQPYSPAQKKVLPPATRSMSETSTPRRRITANCSSPKSSPTGPTTRTSSKKEAASAKCTAAPPSIRSRSPNGVLTVSYAIDPTTVIGMGAHLRAPRAYVMAGDRAAAWPANAPSVPRRPAPRGCEDGHGGHSDSLGSMRAIQMTEFGGPEVLKLAELETPVAGAGEVLIRVTRAGLNFADTHTRTNSYVQKATLPLIPGGEVAGIREDTGERVVALVGTGGYAEYAVAPSELIFPIPA